jgi:Family of unknown function (DUF6099)
MDAVRLVRATRQGLREAWAVPDLIAEAWQAQALAEAVGSHLALHGPPELRTPGFRVCEAGGRACGMSGPPSARAGPVRAALLTRVREPAVTLRELRELLTELGAALASVACTTEEESVYWQCIEAADAADESKDRVCALLLEVERTPGDGP